jgi:hypothetical protein
MTINFFAILANRYLFYTYLFPLMNTTNDIRLRLRFYKDLNENVDTLRQKFEKYTTINSSDYFVKIRGYHIWLNIKGSKKVYWSPHLHLELEPKSTTETHIRGLFGPDPTLWTFFMFLHFMIGGTFLIFCGIAYSDYVLKSPVRNDLIVMTLMVIAWTLLYFIAKQIRSNGHQQMNDLEALFLEIIAS